MLTIDLSLNTIVAEKKKKKKSHFVKKKAQTNRMMEQQQQSNSDYSNSDYSNSSYSNSSYIDTEQEQLKEMTEKIIKRFYELFGDFKHTTKIVTPPCIDIEPVKECKIKSHNHNHTKTDCYKIKIQVVMEHCVMAFSKSTEKLLTSKRNQETTKWYPYPIEKQSETRRNMFLEKTLELCNQTAKLFCFQNLINEIDFPENSDPSSAIENPSSAIEKPELNWIKKKKQNKKTPLFFQTHISSSTRLFLHM